MTIADLLALLGTPAQRAIWLGLFAISAVGLVVGDRSVRQGVGLVLVNFVLSDMVDAWVWNTIRPAVTALDGVLFALLVVLAARSRRWWAHAAAAFALLGFLSHFIALADQSIWWHAYVVLRWCFSAALVVTLLVGIAEAPFARGYERWAATRR